MPGKRNIYLTRPFYMEGLYNLYLPVKPIKIHIMSIMHYSINNPNFTMVRKMKEDKNLTQIPVL
jgi:hypothetical protein